MSSLKEFVTYPNNRCLRRYEKFCLDIIKVFKKLISKEIGVDSAIDEIYDIVVTNRGTDGVDENRIKIEDMDVFYTKHNIINLKVLFNDILTYINEGRNMAGGNPGKPGGSHSLDIFNIIKKYIISRSKRMRDKKPVDEPKDRFDSFYPISESLKIDGLAWVDMLSKLSNHRINAERALAEGRDPGEYESKLINRIGQIRRMKPEGKGLSHDILEEIKLGIKYLKSRGRKIDLENENPAHWISNRDGTGPRW
jgi:hypothetical protein